MDAHARPDLDPRRGVGSRPCRANLDGASVVSRVDREVRDGCILYRDAPPTRAEGDVCAIHAVMLEAEARMRETLARRTLADIDAEVAGKLSGGFMRRTTDWFDDRNVNRRARAGRPARIKGSNKGKRP